MQDVDGEIADFKMAASLNPSQPAFQEALTKATASKNANAASSAQSMYYRSDSEVESLMKDGASKHAAGDREGALKSFEKAIELNPNAENAILSAGVICSESGDQQKAISLFNKALSLNSKNSATYCYRGIAKGRLNDTNGALSDLNKAIEIDSNNVEAFMNRSLTKVNLNDITGAENDLRKARSRAPSDPRLAQVQTLINSRKPQITTTGQSQSVADKQSQAIALNNIASQKIDLNDVSGAVDCWTRSISLYPTADACINMGRIKGMQGSFDDALAFLNDGIRLLQPPDPRPYCLRALVKSQKGDWDGAIRDYTQALKINPSSAEAATMLEKAKAHQL
jgi:tetratricopeptide (TPR) repeat protein